MADVTKSIGTASRDYSTIELWEADLDDSGIYSSGDVAIGQCYNDSVFSPSASITINGGGTIGLTSRTLEAASGEIHDGTEGSGARVVYGGDQIIIVAIPTLIRGLELSGNDADSGSVNSAAIRASATALDVRRCLLHSFLVSNAHCRAVTMEAEAGIMVRCFIYSVTCTSTNTNHHADSVFYFGTPTAAGLWLNITNLRVTRDNANGRSHCYSFPDDSNVTIRNCLGFLSNAGSSTLNGDYRRSSPSNAVVNHVGASDTTASGTNSIDSMTPGWCPRWRGARISTSKRAVRRLTRVLISRRLRPG
jgi:hypothetical protein